MTPLQAIRKKCVDCSGDKPREVKQCNANSCPLHPYRHGKRPRVKPPLTALKSIRAKCLNDCGEQGDRAGSNKCPIDNCHLHKFRMGKNPNYSDETREKRRAAALNRSK